MGKTISTGEAQDRSEFLRRLLIVTSNSDINVSPETLRAASAYARSNSLRQHSPMACIQAELQVLKSLALDMKAALQAERKRLFDLD